MVRNKFRVEYIEDGWWIVDYAQLRGAAPTVEVGPYRTKAEATDFLKKVRTAAHHTQVLSGRG